MWVYVPSKFLASAPEQGDWIEASTWRSEMLAQSCALNTKQLPPSSWLRAWRKGTWMTALFGLISTPSTAERGVAAFRASLLEYPASLIAWPENGEGPTTSATSGLSLQGSFELFSPDGSSSKTSPESSATILSASGLNYQRWVSELRRRSSRRRRLGRPTSERGSSSWPTARGHEAGGYQYDRGNHEKPVPTLQGAAEGWPTPTGAMVTGPGTQGRDGGLTEDAESSGSRRAGDRTLTRAPTLTSVVLENWPTPRAEDSESAGNHPGAQDSLTGVAAERKDEMGLDQQARAFWAKPAASDSKDQVYKPESAVRQDGKRRMDMLEMQAVYGSASSLPDPETPSPGGESSESAPTSRRQLNPRFVEWLMGWEPGWTSLAPLASGSRGMESSPRSQPWPSGSSNWPTPDTMNDRGGADED